MAFFGLGQQDPYAEAEQKAQDQQTAFQGMKDNLPALGLIMGLSMLARNNGTRNVGQLMGMAGGDALNAYSTFQKLEEARKRQKQLDEERKEDREYQRSQDAFRNDMAERKFGLEQAKMAQDMALARQRLGMEGARLAMAAGKQLLTSPWSRSQAALKLHNLGQTGLPSNLHTPVWAAQHFTASMPQIEDWYRQAYGGLIGEMERSK